MVSSGSRVFIIVGLGVGVVLAIGLGIAWYQSVQSNYTASVSALLRPFSASIDPTTGELGGWGADGQPPLSCPTGFGINILAAYSDVVDPYRTCSAKPDPLIGFLCNPGEKSPGACTTDADCPGGEISPGNPIYQCSAGSCGLAGSPNSVVCPEGFTSLLKGGQYYCVPQDLCSTGIPNFVCGPTGSQRCATRNGSAGVAKKCNGQSSCSPLPSDFGDYACPGLAPRECISGYTGGNPNWSEGGTSMRTGYCALPYTPGYSGGPPAYAANGVPSTANSNVGYSFHGVYTCEPL